MARKPDMARREEITRAAFEVMIAQGVRGASMSDVARALGMKRPTLYWYFNDMQAIFEASLDLILGDQVAFIGQRLAAVAHPIDMLFAYAQAVDAFYAEREDVIVFLLQLWAASGDHSPDRVFDKTREFFEPRRRMAVEMLRAGIEDGSVAPCDPEVIVGAVGAFIDGLLIQRITRHTPIEPLHDLLWRSVLEPLRRDS